MHATSWTRHKHIGITKSVSHVSLEKKTIQVVVALETRHDNYMWVSCESYFKIFFPLLQDLHLVRCLRTSML